MRILHAPNNIANQAWAIAQGQRALGHEVEVWHYGTNTFGFPCDRVVPFPPERPTDLLPLVQEAIDRFDVLHFHFSSSLVPRRLGWMPGLWDLPLYRAAYKMVFVTFHGSDVRLRSRHLAEEPWSIYRTAPDLRCDEDDIAKRLEIWRTYATRMFVCSPIEQTWVPDAYFHARAIELDRYPFVVPGANEVPVVAHLPTRRATKGTDAVLAAVETLRARGERFEFRLIENVPSADLPAVLASVDILVDQLLLGDYGVTGIEAMALGRTVLARIAPSVVERMGPGIPVLDADPNSIADVLARAIRSPGLRQRLGVEGRAWVERHHDARVVAEGLISAYTKPGETTERTFPDWASVGATRTVEDLEARISDLAAEVRAHAAAPPGLPRGPFAAAGARADRLARAMRRAARGRRR